MTAERPPRPPAPWLDAEAATSPAYLQMLAAYPDGLSPERIGEWRAGAEAATDEALSCGGRFEVSEREVPAWRTGDPAVRVVVCRPRHPVPAGPAVLHVHGGGLVSGTARSPGDLDLVLGHVADLATTVVSVDYRLAPESPYPAPLEDCLAAWRWLQAEGATALDVDPARVVLAGASAGGCLAAACALALRDRDLGHPIGMMLSAPMLDDRPTSSKAEASAVDVLGRGSLEVCWAAYLPQAVTRDGRAVPARARDLRGLPPVLIDVGSAEVLRDEAVNFAQRLWQAGGEVELHVWPGGYHGYYVFAPAAAISVATLDAQRAWLARQLV